MKIVEKRIVQGPNAWSADHNNLIIAKCDLEGLRLDQQKKIVAEAIEKIPFLSGNGITKVTGISELTKELVTGLQNLAEMPCKFASVIKTAEPDMFEIVFTYEIGQAGFYAMDAAVQIIESLKKNIFPDIHLYARQLERIRSEVAIGPTTAYLLDEVKRRGIPYRQFDNGSLITMGYGSKQKKLRTAVVDTTSGLGIELAGDKEETKKILSEAHLPVPKGILVYTEQELKLRFEEMQLPVVVKPLDGNHGRGVTTNIYTLEDALFGYNIAKKISIPIIVEEYIPGDDYRFLVVNYEFVAAAKRTPAFVTGDGRSTIMDLINEANKDPERGDGSEHVLAFIKVDSATEKILKEKDLNLNFVLSEGEVLYLKDTANISAGGIATDVTDEVDPENKFMAEHVARLFNLDICGIDVVATRVDVPLTREIGGIIEVNAGPGLRMHSNPQKGTPRNVAAPIISMLFPDEDSTRIPLIAVFGKNDNSTLIHLIAELAQKSGRKPGITVKGEIVIQGHLISEGNFDYYANTQDVLFDPLIDFAVVETNESVIKEKRQGFDYCDIVVVPSPANGRKSAENSEEKLLTVKAIVEHLSQAGHLVLSPDNELLEELEGKRNIALYSIVSDERISAHIEYGGLAAIIEDGSIVVYKDRMRMSLMEVDELPSELPGEIALPAILTAVLFGFNNETIINVMKINKKSISKLSKK
ncbi:MAG TPA: cyanophycin synthetase [Bacteroidia bacterium]|jgi:cyanophycin synthetase